MDLAKDAFIVLFCLAGSDGNLDKREQDIIFDFLNSQTACLGQIDFDPQQVYSELAAQSVEGQIEAFSNALQNFKTHSSEQVRSAMLDAAAEVAAADGAITDGEKRLFQTMAAVWEIDLQEFLRQHGVPVAAPTQDSSSEREKRASIFSWTLGGALANYSLNAPLLQPEKSAADFDKAEMSAEVLGLTVRPMPEGFDPLMIKFNSLAYLQKSLKIADGTLRIHHFTSAKDRHVSEAKAVGGCADFEDAAEDRVPLR